MRGVLYASAALFFVTSIQLLLLSDRTATYFAWSLTPAYNASTLGMALFAAGIGQVIAARQRTWAAARVGVLWLWIVSTLLLVVTALHVGEFHFSSPDPAAQFAAWFWVATFVGVSVAAGLATWAQLRTPGVDPPRDAPMPGGLRISLQIQVVMFGVNGALFLLVPGVFLAEWTYPADILAIRIVGAGFLGFAAFIYHASRERDLSRIRPLGGFLTFFAVFELVSLALFAGSARWGSPMTWLLIVWMVALLPIGTQAFFGRQVLRFRSERVKTAHARANSAHAEPEAPVWHAPLTGDRPWFHHWPPGVPKSIDYPDILVQDLLRRTAETHPGWTAFSF